MLHIVHCDYPNGATHLLYPEDCGFWVFMDPHPQGICLPPALENLKAQNSPGFSFLLRTDSLGGPPLLASHQGDLSCPVIDCYVFC